MKPKIILRKLFGESRIAYRLQLGLQSLLHPDIAAESDRFWKECRNLHRGRRGFVIGNGPSLRMSDLAALTDEITIASNKIYLAFESVAWRPTYFSCADWLVWEKIRNEVPRHFRRPLLSSTFGLSTFPKGAVMLRNLGLFSAGEQGFSLDSGVGQYGGFTVTFNNLQTAVHLGLNPIYLIGCDHYYSGELPEVARHALGKHSGLSNHFAPNYRLPGELVNLAPIETMNAAFACARQTCDAVGVRIYNATRGGHLEQFERVSLDDVLSAK